MRLVLKRMVFDYSKDYILLVFPCGTEIQAKKIECRGDITVEEDITVLNATPEMEMQWRALVWCELTN